MKRQPSAAGAASIFAILLAAAGLATPTSAQHRPAPPAATPPQAGAAESGAGAEQKKEDFPSLDKVLEGAEKVISTTDGAKPIYDLYANHKTGRLLAVLPRDFEKQLIMIACTISAGDPEAGVMGPTHYARWERYDKQLALVSPNTFVGTEQDAQAKKSVEQLYTGRVLVTSPIIAMEKGDRPVIDLGGMGTKQAGKFFGDSVFGDYGPSLSNLDVSLVKLTKAKAFPANIVFEYQAPRADGQLVRIAYSFGDLGGTPTFKPRVADSRLGYFYDWRQDFAHEANREVTDRFITRWNLEKADTRLKMSPPKQPIVWYIEHTTPIKFRRYVREGIEMWNQAFEGVGIVGALAVYQQDEASGAHMDKDPEDARYNFFRWNTTDLGYAIGPSRTNPYTGEILDADVVWHQGLTRSVRNMLEALSEGVVKQAFGPETLAWLDEHPHWDPRIRLLPPERRDEALKLRAAALAADAGLSNQQRARRMNLDMRGAGCRIGDLLSIDLSLADAAFITGVLDSTGQETLDGLPEEFLGQMIRYISAHEVGHCLGLQHNMIASTIRTLKEINSPGFTGPTVGSVMDYVGVNINHNLGEVQGPYATTEIGPYDKWAIAYGYGDEKDLDKVRARVGEPDLAFQSQMDIFFANDPRNNTWEMGADNLEFATSRLSLVRELRAKLIDTVVKDGEPWAEARRRYQSLLGTHVSMLAVASRWIGGSYLNNDYKGDPNDRRPVEDVPAERQRTALKLIIDNSFNDEALGLTPELVRYLGKQHWFDPAGVSEIMQDASYTVHDLVSGVQAFSLTLLMNPTSLRRVYDNEFRTSDQPNPLTMVEVITTITDAAWRECADNNGGSYSNSSPMVSSFRRNLQREHVERLETLAMLRSSGSPAWRTISTLAVQELRRIDTLAANSLKHNPDPYTLAHLDDVRSRIARTLEAAYVISR